MTDNKYGYDVVNEVSSAARYLAFKKGDKGRIIQIRLVSAPKYVNQHWITDNQGKQSPVNCEGEDCQYCGKSVAVKEKIKKTAKWGWIVIDRDDGEVKLFTGPTLIARSIKEVSELVDKKTKKPVWGNPLTFDIQIERTEVPGASYYKVTPMPDGKGEPLTTEEQKLVDDCTIDLVEELQGGQDSKNVGNYQNQDLETAPEEIIIPDEIDDGDSKKEDLPF